jgi:hypothetical protein
VLCAGLSVQFYNLDCCMHRVEQDGEFILDLAPNSTESDPVRESYGYTHDNRKTSWALLCKLSTFILMVSDSF